jgi:hypothetical protein
MAGLVLLYSALGGGFLLWEYVRAFKSDTLPNPFIIGGAGLVLLALILIGARLLVGASAGPKIVISAEDRQLLEPLIRVGNEKAIDQYIRLSSLAGATGSATKLGLTGLPLATVALTVIFSMLALFRNDLPFMDLAKLTLGAFIGSFVQRAQTTASPELHPRTGGTS